MMKRFLFLFLFIFMVSPIWAIEFQPIGARQLGMGGAGVASTMDATAQYYNPAIFGFFGRETKKVFKDKDFGINAQIGAGVRLNNNLADNIDNLAKVKYKEKIIPIIENLSPFDQEGYAEALKLLGYLAKIQEDGGAITVNADALLASRIKRFGIGAYGLAEANGKPYVDLTKIRIVDTTTIISLTGTNTSISQDANNFFGSGENAEKIRDYLKQKGFTESQANAIVNLAVDKLKDQNISPSVVQNGLQLLANSVSTTSGNIKENETSIIVNGVGLFEIPVTYGHPINDNLAVGFNIKYIQAKVFSAGVGDIKIFDKDSGDIADELDNYYKESSNFAVDAGILYQPMNWLKIGAVGKYLNSPKFDHPSGGKFKVKPQARAGIALNPWETFTIAADIDLTENETTFPGYKSRNVGGGIEWDILKFLALRAGVYKNLAESDIDMVYTAGLGLNLWLMRLDVSAAISSNRGRYDDKSFPEEARIQANLSIEF